LYTRLRRLTAASSGTTWQGLSALAAALSLTCRSMGRSRSVPEKGHRVAEDFAGICAASFTDPACNRLMLEQLDALGVKQVRVDYTYNSPGTGTDQLLTLLGDKGYAICLHLVQPFEDSTQMHTLAARRKWSVFVRATMRRWGGMLESVEIGSTINRKRWAGYNISGFNAAWRIAVRAVRAHNIRLAGPNVTDFEPLYNAGLLAWFSKRDCVPDVHTNNLFVERVIEPEAFDTRVGGKLMARIYGLNLVKKAQILQKIGAANGVAETWCSHVSWTAPRIRRFIDNAEQKQADYLTRYYVLAAASGAISRVYWGALVCERSGLMADCTGRYPEHERVTLYDISYGEAVSCLVGPAFHALKTINSHLAGASYHGSLTRHQKLETHEFLSASRRLHVVWTTNAIAADLHDIYQQDDLSVACWYSRDGDILAEMPGLATESPIYLSWPLSREIAVNADAKPLPTLSIHRHAQGFTNFVRRNAEFNAVVLAHDGQECDMLLRTLSPAQLHRDPAAKMLRDARNAIWIMPDPRDPALSLVVKQPVRLRPWKKIYQRLRPSKARQSWNGACELLRRGIDTPRPVAFFESLTNPLTGNFYICEFTPDALPVRKYLTAYAAGESAYEGVSAGQLYRELSAFTGKMHNMGVYFRDLSSGNILLKKDAEGRLVFSLVDTARARFYTRPATLYQRLSDLKRLCFKLDWQGREEFMDLYLKYCGLQPSRWHRIPFMFYDFKINTKRRLFGKRTAGAILSLCPISMINDSLLIASLI